MKLAHDHDNALNWTITLENISLELGMDTLLHSLNFTMAEGKTTVILGQAGCGKSLALKIAAGLRLPSFGHVLYGTRNIHRLSDKEWRRLQYDTGFAFQDAALWANQSIFQNLAMPLKANDPRIKGKEVEAQVMEALARVGYSSSPLKRPAEVSRGERKLVSLARALMFSSKVLFLDEPYDGLDDYSIERIEGIIEQFKAEQITVAISTTKTSMALSLADHLVILEKGRLLMEGPLSTLARNWPQQLLPLKRAQKDQLQSLLPEEQDNPQSEDLGET